MAGNISIALVALDLLPLKERRQCIQTLIRIHRNVHENPDDPRYRTLKLSNKCFFNNVWNHDGGQFVMKTAGWRKSGNIVELPWDRDVSQALEYLLSNREVCSDEREMNVEKSHSKCNTTNQHEEEQEDKSVKEKEKEPKRLKKELLPNVCSMSASNATDSVETKDEDNGSSSITAVGAKPKSTTVSTSAITSYKAKKSQYINIKDKSSTYTTVDSKKTLSATNSALTCGEMNNPHDIYKKLHMTLQVITKALAVLYKELTKVSPGKTVEDYCKSTFGYNSEVFKNRFTYEERDILSDPFWDPFQQNVTILMKLLKTVCELELSKTANHKTQTDTIENNLKEIKSIRNEIVQCENFDQLSAKNCNSLITSLKTTLSNLFQKTELLTSSPISKEARDLIVDLDKILVLPVPLDLNHTNSMELIIALQPCGPITKALGAIYNLLTEVPPGRPVWVHPKRSICDKIFSAAELNILGDPPWNPSQQNVPFLYRLLQNICGLANPSSDKWMTQSDTIEYHLTHIRNIRNEIINRNIDEIDLNYIHTVINSLQILFSKVFKKIESIKGKSTSNEVNDLIIDLDKVLSNITHNNLTTMPDSDNTVTEALNSPIILTTDTVSPLFALSTSSAATSGSTSMSVTSKVAATPVTLQMAKADNRVNKINQAAPATNRKTATNDITEGDLNLLRFFMAVRRKSPTAKALAFIYTQLTKVVPGQNMEDYFKSINRNFNKEFTKNEQAILTDPCWDPYFQDVALLYKILQKSCGLFRTGSECHTKGNLEYDIKIIKDHRNYLSHEAVTLNQQELQNIFDGLKTSFENVFQKLIHSSPKDDSATKELKKLKDDLDHILNSQVRDQLSQDCLDQLLAEAKNEKALYIFKEGNKELNNYYACHLKSASPISWLLDHFSQNVMLIDDVFTDLEIFQDSIPVKLENLLTLGKAVIVQGLPGIGKSTAVKYMACKWPKSTNALPDSSVTGADPMTSSIPCVNDSEISELKNTNMLLVMRCRYILSENLAQYLKEDLLKNSLKDIEKEEIISFLNLGNVTVIVDGWDEAKEKAKDVVCEALQKLTGAQFIFTSRPEFRKKLEKIIPEYSQIKKSDLALVKIFGFSAKERSNYVKKVFSLLNGGITELESQIRDSHISSTSSEEQFLKFIEEKEDVLGEMTYVPLTLAFLIVLWNDDIRSVSSVTSTTVLFEKLLEMMTGKLVERLSKKCGKDDYELQVKCNNWFTKELGQEAWNALQRNDTSLSNKKKLESCCENVGLNMLEMFSSFLISESAGYAADCQWSFRHKTVQEFCAASYLVNLIIEENISIISLFFPDLTDHTNLSHSDLCVKDSKVVLNFLCGLLCFKKLMTPDRASEIIKVSKVLSGGYKIVGRLMLEAENNSIFFKCVSELNFTLDQFHSSDSPIVKVLLEHTNSNLSDKITINVKKVTVQLLDVISQHCYLPVRPTLRFICADDINAVALKLQKILKESEFTKYPAKLTLSTSYKVEGFIGGNSKNVQDILSSRPNLAKLISSHKQKADVPDDIKNIQEYIGVVNDDFMPEAQWLLKHTQCRLHPGIGRSIHEILEIVEGLKELIEAEAPTSPLPKHVRELWCAIGEVNHDDIPVVSWLTEHTRCRMFTWSQNNQFTGAHVHVQKGASTLAQMVGPHFRSINRGVPLVFKFPSLEVLQNEGTLLVKNLFHAIPYLKDKEELIILMDIEFSSPSDANRDLKI